MQRSVQGLYDQVAHSTQCDSAQPMAQLSISDVRNSRHARSSSVTASAEASGGGVAAPNSPLHLKPLPKPPWVSTLSCPEACQQILDYSARLEMPTVLLAAQVVASVLCVAQQSAWICRKGDAAGCAMEMATGTAALAHARELLDLLGGVGANPRPGHVSTHRMVSCVVLSRNVAKPVRYHTSCHCGTFPVVRAYVEGFRYFLTGLKDMLLTVRA